MKLALAQMSMSCDMQANYNKSIAFFEEAAKKKAHMILFPEIQLSPFFPQYPDRDVSSYVMHMDSPYTTGKCIVNNRSETF